MPRVVCDWLGCKFNKNHSCRASYVKLNKFDISFTKADVNGKADIENDYFGGYFVEGTNCSTFKSGKKVDFYGK